MRCEENLIGPLIFMNPAMNSDYRQKRQKRQSCDAFDVFDASLDPSLLFANDPLVPSSPLRSCVFRMAHQLFSCPPRFETRDFDFL
jgi:hypothetical protein